MGEREAAAAAAARHGTRVPTGQEQRRFVGSPRPALAGGVLPPELGQTSPRDRHVMPSRPTVRPAGELRVLPDLLVLVTLCQQEGPVLAIPMRWGWLWGAGEWGQAAPSGVLVGWAGKRCDGIRWDQMDGMRWDEIRSGLSRVRPSVPQATCAGSAAGLESICLAGSAVFPAGPEQPPGAEGSPGPGPSAPSLFSYT
ncbi:uncharacterized protein ACIB01_014665 [Guaruba guarouba]